MIGRWGRAAALLQPNERRVLDAGCAFGFGTAGLATTRDVVGLEASPDYLAAARRRYPDLCLVRGDVQAMPFADASFDAVVLLDVLEHLPDPDAALREIARVLRPGGALIVSVPAAGPLAGLDSLNAYARLARRHRWHGLASDEGGAPTHRHFRPEEIARRLPGFRVEAMERTGLGVGEPVNLALMVLFRGLLRWESGYRAARFLGFALTILDDALPMGPLGYNLYLRLRNSRCSSPAEGIGTPHDAGA